MKVTVVFLVLSMVVLMAQPSEGFFGLIMSAISGITSLVRGGDQAERHKSDLAEDQMEKLHLDQQQMEQQKLDQRSFKSKLARLRSD
uniref:Uncharacterized protein n=1 Tax=Iconisemion striatum TaxID=60296 RepID=A0A1A7WLK6_9TELE